MEYFFELIIFLAGSFVTILGIFIGNRVEEKRHKKEAIARLAASLVAKLTWVEKNITELAEIGGSKEEIVEIIADLFDNYWSQIGADLTLYKYTLDDTDALKDSIDEIDYLSIEFKLSHKYEKDTFANMEYFKWQNEFLTRIADIIKAMDSFLRNHNKR